MGRARPVCASRAVLRCLDALRLFFGSLVNKNKIRDSLIRLPRLWKRATLVCADVVAVLFAAILALLLHGYGPGDLLDPSWPVVLVLIALPIAAARSALYTAVIRYIAIRAAFNICKAVAPVIAGVLVLGLFSSAPLLQPPVAINFGIFLLVGLGAVRLAARSFLASGSDRDAERLVIFGAGDAGAQLAQSLSADRRRRVLGFIDDKRELVGTIIAGVPVYASTSLPSLIESRRIDSVLLALPSASRRRKQRLLNWLEPLPVTVKTVPALQAILSGEARISDIRDIEIEDLLGRDPVPPNDVLLSRSIVGHTVMVTGAGGSIGSELCRQIARLRPAHLLLFEVNEHALFSIDGELRQLLGDGMEKTRVTAIMGDVRDRAAVNAAISRFGVQTLYHAAAYKHVPLVEQNVGASLRNNVLGTRNVAEAAAAYGVERFILISTDKAVRPTNIMGATKRAAELLVQAISARSRAQQDNPCVFSMVRFGNVLGSSGSVVPHFREQIRAGGPVTVTHGDITRYFMTIPEASQLVIQAGAMAKGGEVFVLDMGRPVRIVDLAERMIHLAGYTRRDDAHPDGDIDIVFTGLRPGEKLFEELLIADKARDTAHAKIGCADEHSLPWSELQPILREMEDAAFSYEPGRVKGLLQRLVPEYRAARDDHDSICNASARPQPRDGSARERISLAASE